MILGGGERGNDNFWGETMILGGDRGEAMIKQKISSKVHAPNANLRDGAEI